MVAINYDNTILTNTINILLKTQDAYNLGIFNNFNIDAKRLVQINNEFFDYIKNEMVKT